MLLVTLLEVESHGHDSRRLRHPQLHLLPEENLDQRPRAQIQPPAKPELVELKRGQIIKIKRIKRAYLWIS